MSNNPILDYITKAVNDSLNELNITQNYSLASIFEVLQPNNYMAKYFFAKIYYQMEFWAKAEIYSCEAINLLELITTRNKRYVLL